MLIGATAAKKLILKFLLFLFPALSHIFKLCSYYHSNYHTKNYHHHHHSIKHLHAVSTISQRVLVPVTKNLLLLFQLHPQIVETPEIIFSHPPKGHPSEYVHSAPVPPHASHEYHGPDWEFSGPGLGSE